VNFKRQKMGSTSDLVSLYNFRWRVVRANEPVSPCPVVGVSQDILVMRLVILVPFIAGMDAIEISRFPGPIFVLPIVGGRVGNVLFEIEKLLFFIKISLGLSPIQSLRCKVSSAGSFLVLNFNDRLCGLRYKSRSSNCSTVFELNSRVRNSKYG
jgi:hypothetical protein